MNKSSKVLFFFLAIFSFTLFANINANKVSALTTRNNLFDSEITINRDSSMDIKEEIVNTFNGEFHGLRRDIPLDPTSDCRLNDALTCGGFDQIIVKKATDLRGNPIPKSEFSTYTFVNNSDDRTYFRFEWEIYEDGESVYNEQFGWILEYQILGGIGWIGENPYFYWNTIAGDRGSVSDTVSVRINFPIETIIDSDNLRIYESAGLNYNANSNSVVISANNYPSPRDITVSYKFQKSEIIKPGKVIYKIISPIIGNEVYLNNSLYSEENEDTINSFPTGTQELRFSHSGYKDSIFKLNIEPGETKTIEVNLEPESYMQLLLLLNWICFFGGLISIPVMFVVVYFIYRSRGRDKDLPKVVVPLFEPPKDVPPYLLGSLKDETVDKRDLVGSIIDLAYRGYIKIEEIEEKKKYKFILQEKFKEDTSKLDDIEIYILIGIFGEEIVEERLGRKPTLEFESKAFIQIKKTYESLGLASTSVTNTGEVTTDELKYSFPIYYQQIVNNIYSQMVSKGFFSQSPETTRNIYSGCGVALFIFAFIATCFFSIFFTMFLGYIAPFGPGFAVFALGLGYLISAKYMPAKTSLGSKVYNEILGFKMYLNTAERYRLQNLGPEEFERFLAYAIVFGIEKEWAKKFEGIYNQQPEWYSGNVNAWDAIFVSNLVRDFSDSTISNIVPVSGSSSGSGWSGSSSSFGGFSGGGGGGGSSGGW